MQGRLSECIDEKIQAFPWGFWEDEFVSAHAIDMHLMEWTLDQNQLYKNPLMTLNGKKLIKDLCCQYNFSILSLTGDCFMQAPFWKIEGLARSDLKDDFIAVCHACAELGIQMVVLPLVDNGRLETEEQEQVLIEFMLKQQSFLADANVKIIFESDYAPRELKRFIKYFPSDSFGINYDTGNSAALGFAPEDEFDAYGSRVLNVHIKDRLFDGITVPLGTGAVDFEDVFSGLSRHNYKGNFILQTSRASDGNHAELISKYRDKIVIYMQQYGLAT